MNCTGGTTLFVIFNRCIFFIKLFFYLSLYLCIYFSLSLAIFYICLVYHNGSQNQQFDKIIFTIFEQLAFYT